MSASGDSAGVQDEDKTGRQLSSADSEGNLVGRSILTRLFEQKEFSDVKFTFSGSEGEREEKIIYGHKMILAMRSPVFTKMFYPIKNIQNRIEEIRMDEHKFSFDGFRRFLKFIYTDKICYEDSEGLTFDIIVDVMKCAEFYDVPQLKNIQLMQKNIEY